MTVRTISSSRRRGACPGLSAPMPTGDGLLVRLMPTGTMSLAAFSALCTAAQEHGNGIVEITGRGSLQVRGLNAASAPRFAEAVAALNIAVADGVPVLSGALAGLDPEEILNSGVFAADLRRALAGTSLAARLAPKVSVVIDGGGAVDLDEVAADVRLRAEVITGDVVLRVSVGGDGVSAIPLGIVAPGDGIEAAIRLLEVIARHGRDARARDVIASEGVAPFQSALQSCPAYAAKETKDVDGRDKPGHDAVPVCADVIGVYRLRDGSLACGIGLAFGHADAPSLERLTDAARGSGASGVRAAAGRALMIIGLTADTAPALVADAARHGFVVRADDPRRYVVACAGAPICSSAHLAARAIAPLVAEAAGTQLDAAFKIHISGCAKGCAYAGKAAVTVVGSPSGCALIANGAARDTAFATIAGDDLPAAIAGFASDAKRKAKYEKSHV
jgi:precorrin-3B synthase